MAVIVSKLFRPILRPDQVPRPRLVRRLHDGLRAGRPLTLVSAPAGYGKSTLVAEWLAALGQPSAWLSLDPSDDSPARFLLYVVAALRQLAPDLGQPLFSVLQTGQMPASDLAVTTLINEVAAWPDRRVLVLDDAQLLQHPAVLDLLTQLITHQPASLHLVLITREDPPLPLTRARARDQVTEVRAADLRFTPDECARLLRDRHGLSLSPETVARLTERTEGWAAGLQLAGLSLQGQDQPDAWVATLTGSNRLVLTYLTEEVLRSLPARLQTFLLHTSILPELCADLCAAVTGRSDCAAVLEQLLTANVFLIPLDDAGRWYRYHHLFAELLRHHLRHGQADVESDLHRRASTWHARHDRPAAAIDHALAAGDLARVTDLLRTHLWRLLNQGEARAVQGWLDALPAAWLADHPTLTLGFAWGDLLRGQFAAAQQHLTQADDAITPLPPDETTRRLRTEALALRANLLQAQGDVQASLEAGQAALAQLPAEDDRLAGLVYLALGGAYRQSAGFAQARQALEQAVQASQRTQDWVTWMLAVSHLTLMAAQHGHLRFAAQFARQAITQVQEQGLIVPPIVGSVHGALGLITFETGSLDEARQHLLTGIRLSTFAGHPASRVYTQTHLARLHQAEGDLDAAERLLAETAGIIRRGVPGWVRPEFVHRMVAVQLARGDQAAAQAVLAESGIGPEAPADRRTDWVLLGWLRLLVERHDPGALPLAERILAFAQADQRGTTAVQALLLGALAGGGPLWCQRAIALAGPEGYRRIFTDEGPGLHRLLLAWRGRQAPADPTRPYLDHILAGFPPAAARPALPLIEPLTERETEVLRLLAGGLTYADIAARLVVSINTVRYHIKGLYGKLGVDSQHQAVEQARRFGLLEKSS